MTIFKHILVTSISDRFKLSGVGDQVKFTKATLMSKRKSIVVFFFEVLTRVLNYLYHAEAGVALIFFLIFKQK